MDNFLARGLDRLRSQLILPESVEEFDLVAASWQKRFEQYDMDYFSAQLLKVITFDWLQRRAVEAIFRLDGLLVELSDDNAALYRVHERMLKRQRWYEKSFAAAVRMLKSLLSLELLEVQIHRQRHSIAKTYLGVRDLVNRTYDGQAWKSMYWGAMDAAGLRTAFYPGFEERHADEQKAEERIEEEEVEE